MRTSIFRNPRTTQERRVWQPDLGRPARAPHRLPDFYAELIRRDRRERSWKRHRQTQYKTVEVGGAMP